MVATVNDGSARFKALPVGQSDIERIQAVAAALWTPEPVDAYRARLDEPH